MPDAETRRRFEEAEARMAETRDMVYSLFEQVMRQQRELEAMRRLVQALLAGRSQRSK